MMAFLNVKGRANNFCLVHLAKTFGSISKLMGMSMGLLRSLKFEDVSIFPSGKKRLSPAVEHAGHHLALIFQAHFMISITSFRSYR